MTGSFDPASLRIGQGYDVHAFAEGRRLVLGGVDIPHARGLLGHSDADVLAHAIADALLGGIRGGDIGKLFPDADPAFKDADSLKLLAAVADKVREEGYAILDVDSVIAAQAPKLSDGFPRVLITKDRTDYGRDGVRHVNLYDFLLGAPLP